MELSILEKALMKAGSQSKLAKAIGVCPATVYKWVSDKMEMRDINKLKLSVYIDEDVKNKSKEKIEKVEGIIAEIEALASDASREVASILLDRADFIRNDLEGAKADINDVDSFLDEWLR